MQAKGHTLKISALISQDRVTSSTTPERIDNLWDVNILRNAPQQVPAAPTQNWTAV